MLQRGGHDVSFWLSFAILSPPSPFSLPHIFFSFSLPLSPLSLPFISSPSPFLPSTAPLSPSLSLKQAILHPRFQTCKRAKLLSLKGHFGPNITNNTLQHVRLLRVSRFQTEC